MNTKEIPSWYNLSFWSFQMCHFTQSKAVEINSVEGFQSRPAVVLSRWGNVICFLCTACPFDRPDAQTWSQRSLLSQGATRRRQSECQGVTGSPPARQSRLAERHVSCQQAEKRRLEKARVFPETGTCFCVVFQNAIRCCVGWVRVPPVCWPGWELVEVGLLSLHKLAHHICYVSWVLWKQASTLLLSVVVYRVIPGTGQRN